MTVTSGPSTSRGGKKAHWLLKMIVRRNCYICFAITVICLSIATATIITYSVWMSDKALQIQNAKLRRERLLKRSKFEAFFQSSCPIFPAHNLSAFDDTYCNRYCEKNVHMEFMYRMIKVDKPLDKMDCPYYVVLRSCQQRMFKNEPNITSHCEAKKFNKDFISIEESDGNSTKTGICVPCKDDADNTKNKETTKRKN